MALEIKKPCGASWDDMPQVGEGRHCAACRKQVVDFTSMTTAEIEVYLKKAPGQVCGRINRAYLLAPLLLAGLPGLSQSDSTRTFVTGGLVTVPREIPHTVRVKIMDGREPVIGANLVVAKTKGGYVTNELGETTVIFPADARTLSVVVTAVGYEQKKITLRRSESTKDIRLLKVEQIMGDVVIVREE